MNSMYKFSILCVVILAMIACGSPTEKSVIKKTPDSVTMIPTDTMIQTTDTSIIPSLVESWKSYEAYNGKYAADVKLLQLHPLKGRIKAILGADEADFMLRYKVTPPIEVESGILFNEGCKPHDCTVEEAAIAIDMRKDVIYVGIARNKAVKLYGERGDSAYPEKLLQWMMKFEESK
ncbi:hypothetical protein GFS24_11175 [Chitinophaga sp. SYP-B3965]|uniref:hypothetical protein n=1 Tax=Chitinophaga sp. SYP-B3965 TaxID=2663120 RepID=UPI001299D459|nr:hypothetical protein [Chitinophaga sp. SYP-B3965]MRG45682.1 hypothetical protein [Chitinophaga sp. SYP-B3965]